MTLRSFLGVAALVMVAALPAVGPAQSHRRHHNTYYGGYGRGPFYPSWIPGASGQYYGSGGPYRINGLTYYFGPGGATYYNVPPYGYAYPERRASRWRRDSRSRRDYPLRTRRGWR